MRDTLQIGEMARKLGLNAKTIRYYEEIGLLPDPGRAESGYRQYTLADVERIDFVRRARAFGLSLSEIREILALREKGKLPSSQERRLLEETIRQVDSRIADLRTLQRELCTLREGKRSA